MMQPQSFTFAMDAVGSPDNITLPADFQEGICRIRLKPPVGHAWTFYGISNAAFPLTTDEALDLGPLHATPGMVLGRCALDTGSGTGLGVAS